MAFNYSITSTLDRTLTDRPAGLDLKATLHTHELAFPCNALKRSSFKVKAGWSVSVLSSVNFISQLKAIDLPRQVRETFVTKGFWQGS